MAIGVQTKMILIGLLKHARSHRDRDLTLCHSLVDNYFQNIERDAFEFLTKAMKAGIMINREQFIESIIARYVQTYDFTN